MAESKWMKIDPHVHSLGISMCSDVDCKEIVDEKLRLGYEGAILTNHCQRWYYEQQEHADFIHRLIAEYERGVAYAQSKNFQLWLGIEVTIDDPHYADWLLYGVTKEFLQQTPCLYNLTQEALFRLCEEHGVLMVQAHPFRTGHSPCDPKFMHGVELNCNHRDLGNVGRVEAFAKEHGLLITCGTDYHHFTHSYHGGMFAPRGCASSKEFVEHIKKEKCTCVFMEGKELCYTAKGCAQGKEEEKSR